MPTGLDHTPIPLNTLTDAQSLFRDTEHVVKSSVYK